MIKFNLTNGETVDMSLEQMTRWCCLLEAVDSIEKKCEEAGKNMDQIDWVKPLAMQKYIEERYHAMLHDVTIEHERGII